MKQSLVLQQLDALELKTILVELLSAIRSSHPGDYEEHLSRAIKRAAEIIHGIENDTE